MKVFDVLSRKQKIQGKIFLEAAAGCGKTFAIEHIIARLIVEEGVPIEQCLVVTFTKAAAIDLKKRIFTTLVKIEQLLLSKACESNIYPYLQIEEDKEIILRRVQAAIENLNQAMITTIHGFCYRFLVEQAFFVGIPMEQGDEIAVDELVKDGLRSLPEDLFPYVWLRRFNINQLTIDDAIFKKLNPYLLQNIADNQKITFDEFYRRFLKLRIELKKKIKDNDLDNFYESQNFFNGLLDREKNSKFPIEQKIIKELFCDEITSQSFFEIFLQLEKYLSLFQYEFISKKSEKDPKAKEICCRVIELLKPFYQLVLDALYLPNIALNLLSYLQNRIKKDLEKNPLSHPDYLLQQMSLMTEKKEIQKVLQDNYTSILIDEFQDTDPLQWKIFNNSFFYSPKLKLFVCVGDPKQSIYGFRNADLATYLLVKEAFTKENCYILDTNYRSEKQLIDGLNECFMANKPYHFFYYDNSDLKIDYFPIKACYEKLWHPTDSKKGLHYIIFKGKNNAEIEQSFLFSYLSNEVHSLIKQGIKLENIAFLVKDRYQGQRVKEYLEKKGIYFDSLKTDSLTEKDGYTLFLSILEYIADYSNQNNFKKIVFHPYVRNKEYFSNSFLQDDFLKLKSFIDEKFENCLSIKFIPKIISTIIDEFKIMENVLRNHHQGIYDEIVQLKEIVFQLSLQSKNFTELFQSFNYLKEEKSQDTDFLKKRPSVLEKTPTIITMHSSKGLEYDVVFVLGLYENSDREQLLCKIQDNGEKKWGIPDLSKADLQSQDDDMEKMRQFYVAMTRAKKRVYFPVLLEEEAKEKNNRSALQLFLGKSLLQTDAYEKIIKNEHKEEDVIKFLSNHSHSSIEVIKEISCDVIPLKELNKNISFKDPLEFSYHQEKIKTLSFSQLAKKTNEEKIFDQEITESVGAAFGVFFHELVEKMIEVRLYEKTDSLEFRNWIKKKTELTAFESDFEVIIEMLHLLMTVPLIDSKYALKEFPYSCLMTEMKWEICMNENKNLKGFIDLLVFFDGKITIIDFKTNYLGSLKQDYSEEKINIQMYEKEYNLQAACYWKAVDRFLKKGFLSQNVKIQEVLFIFVRGLKYNQGIKRITCSQEYQKDADEAVLSRI